MKQLKGEEAKKGKGNTPDFSSSVSGSVGGSVVLCSTKVEFICVFPTVVMVGVTSEGPKRKEILMIHVLK